MAVDWSSKCWWREFPFQETVKPTLPMNFHLLSQSVSNTPGIQEAKGERKPPVNHDQGMRCRLSLTGVSEEWGGNQRRGDLSQSTPPCVVRAAVLDHYPKWEDKTIHHSVSSFLQATERCLSKRKGEFRTKPLCGHWNWRLLLQANASSITFHRAMELPFNSA